MPDEPDKYCDIDQCDVPKERRDALQRFRSRRRVWLSWLDTDEDHAIWRTLNALVWRDVAFKALTAFALCNDEIALHNPLVAEALINGHVAAQVLAIRRLTERTPKERLSLRWLVSDLKKHIDLFTRENWVCYDGLPYDYQVVRDAHFSKLAAKKEATVSFMWGATEGPEADGASEIMHQHFDKLAGVDPAARTREDRLRRDLLSTIDKWLDESGADDLAKWASTYLAHAGGPSERARLADMEITSKKIADAIKALARATEAISLFVYGGGRAGAVMPVAQYNQFEKLDKPIIRQAGDENTGKDRWRSYSAIWDRCLDGVEDELLGRPGLLSAAAQTIGWMIVFFVASPAASAAYLTVSETFPLEIRALTIAIFYAIGTGLGGVAAPLVFGELIESGSRQSIFGGYVFAALLMFAAAFVAARYAVNAERKPLEQVATPLSAVR